MVKLLSLLVLACGLVVAGVAATVGVPLAIDAEFDSPCPGHATLHARAHLNRQGPVALVRLQTVDDEALRQCLHVIANDRPRHRYLRNIKVTQARFLYPDQIRLKGRVTLYKSKHLRRTTKLQDGRINWVVDEDGLLLKTFADLDIWGALYDKRDRKRHSHEKLSRSVNCWGRLADLGVSEDERALEATVTLWPFAGC